MEYCIAALIGYLLGCSNMAMYLAKLKKIDLRAAGSGNPGTSNATILMGWPAGILTGAHDIGKGVLAVAAAKLLFPETPFVGMAAGAAAVVGHIFPVFMKFRGGKGLAAFLGMTLGLNWKLALAVMALLVAVTLITDYIVVGTVVTVLAVPPALVALQHSWWPLALVGVTALILYRHRENYPRILAGTEIGLRSTFKKKEE